MGTQGTTHRDQRVGALADHQHGVVSREQLLAAGLSARVIRRAVEAGRLRPLLRGIYGVGHVALRREGWWVAALLAGGPGSALSHRSAATLWHLRTDPILPVDLTTSTDRCRKRDRITTHRTRLAAFDTVVIDGLRVTTPARTLVDLATVLDGRPLREAVERAQDLRRFDADDIMRTILQAGQRRGARRLAELVALLGPDKEDARSHLERLFLALVRRTTLAKPVVNLEIAGRRRDFAWLDHRLVVETDGYRYHASRQAKRRDHRRDRELTALGWRPVRFTYEEIALEPAGVARELAALLGPEAS